MTNIDFTKSEQYTLSIRLSADGFSFSIHHPQTEGEYYSATFPLDVSYSMTANIRKMIQAKEELNHPYGQTNILIDTSRFTPIPFDLYEDEHCEELFYYNFQRQENETVLCNILSKSNVAILFGMDKHAHQLLLEQFPQARIFACISPLTEHFVQQSRKDNGRNLYVHFRPNKMEFFAFDKGKLTFINSFHCKQPSDQVYYLLYAWQQLGFNQGKDQLWIAGKTENQEELLVELSKFIRKVTLLPMLENLPFDIQTLLTCE